MSRRHIRAALSLILAATAASLYFWQRSDRLPTTRDENFLAVLAKVDGAIELEGLPLENALKQVRGKGELVLVSFEDPDCPYCRELDKKLDRLDNVTLYTFLLPVLSEASAIKSRKIWCSADPVAAWNDWMLKQLLPIGTSNCLTLEERRQAKKEREEKKKAGLKVPEPDPDPGPIPDFDPDNPDDKTITTLDRNIELGETLGIRTVPYLFRSK